MKKYPRGSEWNKWDLHVHTPFSHVQYYGNRQSNETWEAYILDLEALPPEIKVIGVNDYYFLEGYKKLKLEKEQNGRLKNIDLLIPVVELRLRNFSGNNELKKINFHVLFSDQINVEDIEKYFTGLLELELVDSDQTVWKRFLSQDNLLEFGKRIVLDLPEDRKREYGSEYATGAANATFDLNKINELLEHDTFKEKFITAIGKSEWASHTWSQAVADKKRLINSASLIFTASKDPEECVKTKDFLKSQNVNFRVLHSSDAHYLSSSSEPNRIGHCYTWIKADTTFNGLRYALGDYLERVFIGILPPKLGLVAANPTKFIDSIEIRKKADSSLNEKWFDHKIPLNCDLVAIVGNKGSGKSALADILGLLGNTHNFEHFSFLAADRFRDLKTKKASHYYGCLDWVSGRNTPVNLDQDPDLFDVEKVKYIPQSYLEEICNEVGKDKETQFDKEIKNVIFSHIPAANKLGKYTFNDLVSFKAEETNNRIAQLKIDLSKTNYSIADLEAKSTQEEIERIKNQIKGKQTELEVHEKNKPQTVPPPLINEDDKQTNDELAKFQLELESISEELQRAKIEKSTSMIRDAKLEKIREKIRVFSQYSTEFQEDLSNDLHDFGLIVGNIIDIKINEEAVVLLSEKIKKTVASMDMTLAENLEGSAANRYSKTSKTIEDLRKKLDEPNRKYQSYLKKLSEWEQQRKVSEGNANSPDSLKYYEAQLDASVNSTEKLKPLKAQRVVLVKKIYKEIQNLALGLKGYYEPVKSFLHNNSLPIKDFDFSFSVEMNGIGFVDQFADWIDSRIAGEFAGIEGRKQLLSLVKSHSFDTEVDCIEFLSQLISKMQTVNKSFPRKHVILQQLRAGRKLNEFYDFIFSLDYLRPKYSLKSGDKELSQLSPGQKGLLLLSFYLIVDRSDLPLIIDQPEENLDNHTVYDLLVPYIKSAKERRQIIIVTHNPNLAVVCDAEQIIWCNLLVTESNKIVYDSGSIENPIINRKVVDVLEGTYKAFSKRDSKYLKAK